MPDNRELSIRASTDEVSPTDSVVIYNERIVHRYSALLQALHTSSGTTRSVSGSGRQKLTWSDDPDADPNAPPYDLDAAAADAKADLELERRAFMMLVGDHKPDEKYGVRRVISTGGMGRLYYVHDSDFERDTAMKVVLPELKNDTSMLRSFIREARITAQLEHPNIIPVHDLGYLPEYGIYFTMKYVDGESLHDILLKLETGESDYLKRYDYVMLLNIFRKVCDAVAFAHSRGVLHRDIKPHNIMVGAYGEVLLMDWGLARAEPHRRAQSPDASQFELDDIEELPGDDQVIKGSPGYMSPEQAEGLNELLDERSDVFLLGATLYHMFTFFPPYLGSTIMDVLESAIACDYLPPETVAFGGLDIPDEVCRIMKKAMAPMPVDRYRTVPDLITDLDDLLHGRMQSERRTFRAGEALMWEGEMGHECYIITEGEVEIFKLNDLGEKILLGRQSKGDIVGEMALITHEPRSASVLAISDTEVMVLTEITFEKNLHKLPAWMARTIQSMAHRLSVTNSRLTDTHTQITRHDLNPPT